MAERIETSQYSIRRAQLSYWSAFEYMRRFWPAFVSFPITGALLWFLLPIPVVKPLAFIMFFWPITVLGRSTLITLRKAKHVARPTTMFCDDKTVYFLVEPVEFNHKLGIDSIRDVKVRFDYVVIELWRYRLLYIPYSAFTSPEQIQEFRQFCGVIPVEPVSNDAATE